MGVRVISFGIPRSGSTFVWQIISDLFPDGVIHTHDYLQQKVPVVATIRDFRDCVISYCHAVGNFSQPQVDKFITYIKNAEVELRKYCQRGNVLILKYESFFIYPLTMLEQIESFLNIEITDKQNVLSKHSIEKNKAIADSLFNKNTSIEYKERESIFALRRFRDPKSHINSNHIYKGEIGGWKKYKLDFSSLRHELMWWGYDYGCKKMFL